jgi:hypothetical protein
MRINPKKMLSNKITIVNRLKGVDNDSGRDMFFKKVLDNCAWNSKEIATRSGNTVTYSNGYEVHIPQAQEYTYFDYSIWKNSENLDDCFTFSVDDYVILGEVEEEITPNNITEVIEKYKPNAFQIRVYEDLTLGGINVNKKFLNNFASMYSAEGV